MHSIPQQPSPAGAAAAPQQHGSFRRLNIEDALTYLDQVKSCYQNNSDIYNNFLDIMKDFNTQKIDTPGVIDRVSTLFGNNPALIQGFNTFLPPDYCLTYSRDPNDPTPIKITTPSGTITRGLSSSFSNFTTANGTATVATVADNSAAATTTTTNNNNEIDENKSQEPIEMDDAINYVNKIKIRFIRQPEIYNSFIEILQTFQREQKPIQEVYQQIAILFKDAPDLLGDFQKFLPDVEKSSGQTSEASNYPQPEQALQQSQPPAQQQLSAQQHQVPNAQPGVQLPPVGNFPPQSHPVVSGRSFNDFAPQDGTEYLNERRELANTGPPKRHEYETELAFFDAVKKHIGNKEVYNNFIKLINLFSNEVIDKGTLVEKAFNFIGSNVELFNWFKVYINYDTSAAKIENVEQKKAHLEYGLLQSCGPSYRRLPKSETFAACSGRDDMCWSVLNDEWVGHPTWASEDSGFVAHKKNQFEEILFKIEEERHEYDFYLEANLRTIQTLETIAKQILAMTPEEKENFNLRNGLRSSSQTIYKKVIKKVYGEEQGQKVIDAIHNTPIVAIPIVLRRLKLKDEEWKRAHREWNKVWREQEQKVYFKSLDHLGLTFKQTDKKHLSLKQLVTEISGLKLEELHKKLTRADNDKEGALDSSFLLINPQLSYDFTDQNILVDIVRLVFKLLKSYSTYSLKDKSEYITYLKLFIQLFFNLNSEKQEKLCEFTFKEEKPAQEEQEDSQSLNSQETNEALQENKKRKLSDEQRSFSDFFNFEKRAKTNAVTSSAEAANGGESNPETLDKFIALVFDNKLWKQIGLTEESVIDLDEKIPKNKNDRRRVYNLFSNTDVYYFFKLFATLYERLAQIKELGKEVNKELKNRKETPFAKHLDLVYHQFEHVQQIFSEDNVYEQTVELIVKLIDGTIDQQVFEEVLRQAYWNKAYKLFSVHKVLHDILTSVKKLSATGSINSSITMLFEQDRSMPRTTVKEQIAFESQVRSLIGNSENLFKISYNEKTKKAQISLVGQDDLILRNIKNQGQDKRIELSTWQTYLSNYLTLDPTELNFDKNGKSIITNANFRLNPFIKFDLSGLEEEEKEAKEAIFKNHDVKDALMVINDGTGYRVSFNTKSLRDA